MLNKLFVIYLLSLRCTLSYAYTTDLRRPATASSRRAFIKTCTVVAPIVAVSSVITTSPVGAFNGAGSSAYAGKSTTSKAELKKSYQRRVIADVKDFKTLGAAINNGETEGDAWVNFFIEYQRREPDSNGRAYAAFVDLVGNKELSGCGTLLAASFAKPGKPSEGLPSVKKYNAVSKTFDAIKAAGQNGDSSKAKTAYKKASNAVEGFLEAVELPPLSDAIYN